MHKFQAACAVALAFFLPLENLSAAYTMQTPQANAVYGTNATVSVAGTTNEASVPFTVDICNHAGDTRIVMNSGSGTTTSMGSYFSCSVPAPSGGWTVTDIASVEVVSPTPDGTIRFIKFQ